MTKGKSSYRWNSYSGDCEKLLGVKSDSKLHFWCSCKKANKKLRALAPAAP